MNIQLFQSGDQVTFKQVYGLLYSRLVYFSFSYLHSQETAEGVVCESFLKLYKLKETMESLDHISAFMFTTCKNGCLDYLKHWKRRKKSHEEIRYLTDEGSTEMEKKILYASLLSMLVKEMHSLPKPIKDILDLQLAGYDNREIAKVLKLNESTLRVYKGRGIDQIKERIARIKY